MRHWLAGFSCKSTSSMGIDGALTAIEKLSFEVFALDAKPAKKP